MNVFVKRLTETAKIPAKAHETDAGYDLYADEEYVLLPNGRVVVKTGIAIEIPAGFYGRVAPRSGLAVKSGLDVLAGVIDSAFRGEVGVVLYNTNSLNANDPIIKINKGQKIAQLIIEKCFSPNFIEVNELQESDRGIDGFGSTGN